MGMLTLTAQTIAASKKVKLDACMSGVRPYSSLRGERNRGPIAKPMTNIDMSRVAIAWLSELKSFTACGTPGTKMVDDMALESYQHVALPNNGDASTTG